MKKKDDVLKTDEDKKIFLDAILNPAKPNEKLKKAQANYKRFKNN